MIISIDVGKAFDKITKLFIIKSSKQIKNRKNFLDLIKSIGKMAKLECHISFLLFNIVLKILASEVTQVN